MRRWLSTLLAAASVAFMTDFAAASDVVTSDLFSARLVSVDADAHGTIRAAVEFEALVSMSQAETIGIRESCENPASATDGVGNVHRLTECLGAADDHVLYPVWLEEDVTPVVRTYEFVAATPGSAPPPYDITIPVTYAMTTEEDRPQPRTELVLQFRALTVIAGDR